MANVDRKWIAPVVIVAAFAASAIAYTRLPSIVTLQMSAVLPFAVPERGEPGPRWLAAFLIPSVSVVLWLAFRFATSERAQRVGRWFFRNSPAETTSAAQFEPQEEESSISDAERAGMLSIFRNGALT